MAWCICKLVSHPNAPIADTGGGIVFDSDEAEEYQETINKLGANVKCIDEAESELSAVGKADGRVLRGAGVGGGLLAFDSEVVASRSDPA